MVHNEGQSTDFAAQGTEALRPGRGWLLALRRRASGGSSFMACRHPDIDEETPRVQSDRERQCVIDLGEPNACEMSADERLTNRNPVADKASCPYWKRLTKTDPAGATPEETLRLVEALLSDGAERVHHRRQPHPWELNKMNNEGQSKASDAREEAGGRKLAGACHFLALGIVAMFFISCAILGYYWGSR